MGPVLTGRKQILKSRSHPAPGARLPVQSMTARRDIERIQRIERDRLTLVALEVLAGGRMPYAQARAEFERRAAALGRPSEVPFDELVRVMIMEKLIDFEAGGDVKAGPRGLWVRAWGGGSPRGGRAPPWGWGGSMPRVSRSPSPQCEERLSGDFRGEETLQPTVEEELESSDLEANGVGGGHGVSYVRDLGLDRHLRPC